ncbi:DctP family TRAP transporter solute-binding subunit [Amphritea sp. 1_MG-2023]|uniref:DctP family TRAP transporter solute-binding subunit n=1 Tax=Amphritea sp. 1_MG-2023 TaxID=3062670 RepID=UPI0026E46B7F|nr:DctP family TRAP transporter solute-binding subunit [Amphritea sp. 1_MG-2023]MDO6562008.1 DctP family TRAP transporter solute-binding subunit [Amphritea sp. 1_MG-2023]
MRVYLFICSIVIAFAALIFFIFSADEPQAVSAQIKARVDGNKPEAIVLRFGHNTPQDSALHEAAMRFAHIVNDKTEGHVVIDVYPAQQLGNDHQMVEMARQGELDIILTPTAKMSVAVPSMQYADLPFLFPSRADAYAMLDGEPGAMLLRDLNSIGLYGMAFWENGFKHFTGNRAFLSPEDFRDTKIRVMKSRMIMEQFKAFAAEPIPIDFHKTKQALADGVIDGQENPLIAIYSMGLHEVQSDLVLSNHAFLGYVLSVSRMTMNKLPFEVQRVLLETAREVTPWERMATHSRETELLERIKASGVQVHTLSSEQRAAFAAKTTKLISQFEGVIGAEIISKTESLLFDKYGPDANANDHYVIGLNVNLAAGACSGLAIKRGVQLAVKDINQRGGLLAKPLHVLVRSHNTVSRLSNENMNYFMQRPDVVAIVGGKHSVIVDKDLPLIGPSHMPYLIPWATAEKLTNNALLNDNVFRLSANDKSASEFIAAHAIKKYKKPALLVENTQWGRDNLNNMRAYLASKEVLPATEIVFNRGQSSYREALETIFKSGADSLILVANANEGQVIISELLKRRHDFPILSHWGILGGLEKSARKTFADANLSIFQTFSFAQSHRSQSEALRRAYIDAFGLAPIESVCSPHAVAQAYDVVQLLALAIEQSGSTDGVVIIKALEQLPSYEGVVKRYMPAFSETNHDALTTADFFMARFNDDGQIIPLR